MKNNDLRIVSGTRDYDSKYIYKRDFIINKIKHIYNLCGFSPLETPSLEYLKTLEKTYGEEGDSLIYRIINSGDIITKIKNNECNEIYDICEKGLRYDLTVPLIRYTLNNMNDIVFPYKRYQIQNVWRADRPQKGRYREFLQCDVDIVGTTSLNAEGELIYMAINVFESLNIKDYVIKINNRKIINDFIKCIKCENLFDKFCNIIDKTDKIGLEKAKQLLQDINFPVDEFDNILKYENQLDYLEKLFNEKDIISEGLSEIKELFAILNKTNVNISMVKYDFCLIRGLSYYDGIVWEGKILNIDLGSVLGGGRYNSFAKKYNQPILSSVGMSFGIDRLIVACEMLNINIDYMSSNTGIMIVNIPECNENISYDILKTLRSNNINTELFLDRQIKIQNQIKYAKKKNIKFLLFPYDVMNIKIRDMVNNEIIYKNMIEIVPFLKNYMKK